MLAIGCGQPSSAQNPRPPEPVAAAPVDAGGVDSGPTLADDLPRLAARVRELFIDWRAAFSDPNTDCATATTRMNELAAKYADVREANKVVFTSGHARIKALKEEMARYDAEIEPLAKAIAESPIMSRCVQDPAFGRAFDQLGGEG